MRFDRELYGVVIDPLYVSIYIYDSNVNVSFSDIDVLYYSHSESNFAYTLDLNLADIQVHGLSSIYLSQVFYISFKISCIMLYNYNFWLEIICINN